MHQWIDFKELRGRLNALDILAFYKVKVKVKGDQAQGFCPLPGHRIHEGKRRSPSFSVSLKRGIFQCFSCGQSGNLMDLVCILEKMDPHQPADVRRTAEILAERYPAGGKSTSPPRRISRTSEKKTPASDQKVVINAPLDFQLKNLDAEHPYLLKRGFTSETIERFGLGFCAKGLMKERIAIPLHDASGNLIGYAGRVVDDKLINEDNPRYRFPSGREKDGVLYDFQKSLFLYNQFAIIQDAPFDELVVVESFTATWWLTQCGYQNVVSVMGASCREQQGSEITNLVNPDGVVIILTDGDEAGERCATSIFLEVAPFRAIRWAKLEKGKQPTDCDPKFLETILR